MADGTGLTRRFVLWSDCGRLSTRFRESLGLVALIASILALAIPGSAQAVLGGETDGNGHPNVGLLAGYDELGLYYTCSGTLVSQTVFLTAAHCLPGPEIGNPTEIRVSFDSDYPLGTDQLGQFPILTTYLSGVPHANPAWDGTRPFDATWVSNDLGVMVLDEPASEVFPGITPAHLAGQGYLNTVAGKNKAGFEVVGYGIQRLRNRPTDPGDFIDWTRRRAVMQFKQLYAPSAFSLRGSPNSSSATGSGSNCSGDSGGAILDGSLLAGVISGVNAYNKVFCKNETYGARIDTASARSFLDDFITLP